jgi:hypothetical protein
MSWREEEEEKKMPFIVATYVYASSQGQRMHSARANKYLDIEKCSLTRLILGNLRYTFENFKLVC